MRVSRIIDNFKNKPNAKPRAQKHEPNQSQDRCQRFLSQPQQEQGGTPLLPWIKKEDCPSSGYQSKAIQPGPGLQSQRLKQKHAESDVNKTSNWRLEFTRVFSKSAPLTINFCDF